MNKICSGGRGRGKRIACLMLIIGCAFFAASPAHSRPVFLVTNMVNVVPGTAANMTSGAQFLDGSSPVWTRNLTSGHIDPSTPFTVANDTSAGTFYLRLTAPDAACPGGAKDRTTTLSAPYTAMGDAVDFVVDVSLLPTIMDTPPPVTGSAAQTGFNLEMRPLVTVNLAVITDAPYTGNYARGYYPVTGFYYQVRDASGFAVESGIKRISDPADRIISFNLDPNSFPAATAGDYTIVAYAYNSYTSGFGGSYAPRPSGPIPFSITGGAGGAQPPFTLTLESNVNATPAGPGINSFAMPFAAPWFVYKEDNSPVLHDGATNEVTNAYQLVKAINLAAGGANVVSSFGIWDKTDQAVKGIMIPGPGYNPDDVRTAPGGGLEGITLRQGEGCQVYVNLPAPPNNKVRLVFKNMP